MNDKELVTKLLDTMDPDSTRKLTLKLLEENLRVKRGPIVRELSDPRTHPRPFRTFTMKIPEEWHTKIKKYIKTPESKYTKMSDLVREAIRQFMEEYHI